MFIFKNLIEEAEAKMNQPLLSQGFHVIFTAF